MLHAVPDSKPSCISVLSSVSSEYEIVLGMSPSHQVLGESWAEASQLLKASV